MSRQTVTCAMCGHSFDPTEHVACKTCPLHQGCNMICCPACGYSTVDTGRSTLVRWVSALVPKESDHGSLKDK